MQADRFVREPERRKITGLAKTTWWRLEQLGRAPKAYQLGRNAKGWKLSELMDWLNSRTHAGSQTEGRAGTNTDSAHASKTEEAHR